MEWTIETVLGFLGGLVLVGNAGAVVYKWIRPALQINERVKNLEQHDKRDYETLNRIEKITQQIERQQRLIMVSQVSTLNHMIDNNNVEDMKKTRDRIQQMLVDIDSD